MVRGKDRARNVRDGKELGDEEKGNQIKKVWERSPHAHPPPVPGSRHLQLINSDHVEELSLCPSLLQRLHKMKQLRGNGDGQEGMFLHLGWVSSQQGSQLVQISQVFPNNLGEGQPQSQPPEAPAFL